MWMTFLIRPLHKWGVNESMSNPPSYVSTTNAWCDAFVRWCAVHAPLSSSIISTFNGGCSTQMYGGQFHLNGGHLAYRQSQLYFSYAYYADTRQEAVSRRAAVANAYPIFANYRSFTPQAGDIVYFYDTGTNKGPGIAQHIGIVESRSGSTIYTIEGNVSDSVMRKSYAYNSTGGTRKILAFYRPNYTGGAIQPGSERVVVGGSLNVRASKSTSSTRLTSIPSGTFISVTSSDGTWGYVTYAGKSGWIMLSYTLAITVCSESRTVINGALNMRSEPSTSASRTNQIPNGTGITITKKTTASGNEWGYTSYGGANGWVMLMYTSL